MRAPAAGFVRYARVAAQASLLRAMPLALALLLVGCLQTKPHPPPPPPPPPVKPEAAAPPAPPPAAPEVPPPVPPLPPPEPFAPSKLAGLSQDQVRELFGDPVNVREESPAVVWSYGTANCGVDLFFYLDLGTKTFKSLAHEMRPKTMRDEDAGACLGKLRRNANDRPK